MSPRMGSHFPDESPLFDGSRYWYNREDLRIIQISSLDKHFDSSGGYHDIGYIVVSIEYEDACGTDHVDCVILNRQGQKKLVKVVGWRNKLKRRPRRRQSVPLPDVPMAQTPVEVRVKAVERKGETVEQHIWTLLASHAHLRVSFAQVRGKSVAPLCLAVGWICMGTHPAKRPLGGKAATETCRWEISPTCMFPLPLWERMGYNVRETRKRRPT